MTKIDKWIIYTKLQAIWYILTNRAVIYGVHFDTEHPLKLATRNLTPDTLVTGCVFDSTGALLQDKPVGCSPVQPMGNISSQYLYTLNDERAWVESEIEVAKETTSNDTT